MATTKKTSKGAGKKEASQAATPTLYKVLHDGHPIIGNRMDYSLPDGTTPGEWHDIVGPLVRCQNGLHLTTDPKRFWQRNYEVYTVETRGELMGPGYDGDHEYVARSLRLVHRLTKAEMDALELGIETRRKIARYAPDRSKYAPKGASPGYLFVEAMWTCAQVGGTKQGWTHFNGHLSQALYLAISAGMEFNATDVGAINDGMRGCYWFGDHEGVYSAAVTSGNTSAALSYEAWRKRTPFIWEGERLYVGARLTWGERSCSVTSFDDAAGTLTACAYHPQERDAKGYATGRVKVEKRYTITRDDVATAAKAQRALMALNKRTMAMSTRLSKLGTRVESPVMGLWTAEEWKAAEAWADHAEADLGKTRVKPAPMPSFMTSAAGASDATVKAAGEACQAWAKAMCAGHPSDFATKPPKK